MDVLNTPSGYTIFDEPGLRRYLRGRSDLSDRLGGDPDRWAIREVSDGNLNLVFLIDGPAGGLCVKQALPHVRVLSSWRLPVERTFFEYSYFRIVGPIAGDLTPAIYAYEPELFAIVMEKLAPHVVLRRGLIAGNRYPRVARDTAEFVARATFFTSDLGQRFESKMDGIALFAKNQSLLRITTDLVFTDPYRDVERNGPARPQLADIAAAFRTDAALKIAAARLAHRFLSTTQALVHGDLHTGSLMVTPDDSRVIDPEFAFYGPIGFDLGAFIGNLLISYFAQPGHATAADPRIVQAEWIVDQIPLFWDHFRARFIALWEQEAAGDAFAPALFADAADRAALATERSRFIDGLYADTIGYAAVKMIRRILGFARVADFLDIADADRRAACERATLELARAMLVTPERFGSIGDLVNAARTRGDVLQKTLGG